MSAWSQIINFIQQLNKQDASIKQCYILVTMLSVYLGPASFPVSF